MIPEGEIRREIVSLKLVRTEEHRKSRHTTGHYEALLTCGHTRTRRASYGQPCAALRCYECERLAKPVADYSSNEVAKECGVGYRQLIRYVERGFLHPRRLLPARDKSAWIWSKHDLVMAKVVSGLFLHNFSRSRVMAALAFLSECSSFDGACLVIGQAEGGLLNLIHIHQFGQVQSWIREPVLILPLY